jgi:hypothetical protein
MSYFRNFIDSRMIGSAQSGLRLAYLLEEKEFGDDSFPSPSLFHDTETASVAHSTS